MENKNIYSIFCVYFVKSKEMSGGSEKVTKELMKIIIRDMRKHMSNWVDEQIKNLVNDNSICILSQLTRMFLNLFDRSKRGVSLAFRNSLCLFGESKSPYEQFNIDLNETSEPKLLHCIIRILKNSDNMFQSITIDSTYQIQLCKFKYNAICDEILFESLPVLTNTFIDTILSKMYTRREKEYCLSKMKNVIVQDNNVSSNNILLIQISNLQISQCYSR